MCAHVDITVPPFGQGLDEALLLEWLVAEGAPVRRGDAVAHVETVKANTEVVAERDGTVVEHLVDQGTILRSGEALYRLAPEPTAQPHHE